VAALALAALARLTCAIAALPVLIGNRAGWRRHAAAFAAGALSVLAMAPFHAWPVLFVTLPTLIWLLDGVWGHSVERECAWRPAVGRLSLRRAAAVGWWFGFGYFVAGLYWVGAAFLVDAKTFAFLLPLAVTGLPAALALFYALAAVLALPFWGSGPYRILALALSLSAMEYARGHAFTGFPWNVLGYALTYPVSLLQSAALFGIYGLTLIACLMLPAPLVLLAAAPGAGPSAWRWRSPCCRPCWRRAQAICGWRATRPPRCRASSCAWCSRACRRPRNGGLKIRSGSFLSICAYQPTMLRATPTALPALGC
jgi:apolipoprotein N-acyltransferase